MRVTIYTSDRGSLQVDTFDESSLAALLDAFRAGDPVLTVQLDGGAASMHIATAHVVRIDVDR